MTTLRHTLLTLANRFLETLPESAQSIDWQNTLGARWVHDRANMGHLRALKPRLDQTFEGLIGVDQQASQFKANLELFLKGLPANATLLWGARGTGKSSMVRAALTAYHERGLRIVEVEKAHLGDLPAIVDQVRRGEGDFGSGRWRHRQLPGVLDWVTDNDRYLIDIDTPEHLEQWSDAPA